MILGCHVNFNVQFYCSLSICPHTIDAYHAYQKMKLHLEVNADRRHST
jgi:hypothetical protein